ncbi:MAG: aminoglycoside phosphotransferase family protein [Thermodesulfobacteriota bacterium]
MDAQLKAIAAAFISGERLQNLTPLGRGNINDTYLAVTDKRRFVLQRINADVFGEPLVIMANLEQLCRHLQEKQATGHYGLIPPQLLTSRQGLNYFQDENGHLWRASTYVENSRTCKQIENPSQAASLGRSLAHFHLALADLETNLLRVPLPGFHHLPGYLQQYDRAQSVSQVTNNPDETYCRDIIKCYRPRGDLFEKGLKNGHFSTMLVHGDPKVENFLFDDRENNVVAIIDLDTTGPGLLNHDIGDCLRSASNPTDEAGENIRLNLDRCEVIIRSYLDEAGTLIDRTTRDHIFDGFELICFELGLRFFTDHLEGSHYFKTSDPLENLGRSTTQFRLLEAVSAKEGKIRKMVEVQPRSPRLRNGPVSRA